MQLHTNHPSPTKIIIIDEETKNKNESHTNIIHHTNKHPKHPTIVKQEQKAIKNKTKGIPKEPKNTDEEHKTPITIENPTTTTNTTKIIEESSLPILEQPEIVPSENTNDPPTPTVTAEDGISITDPNGRVHTIPYNVIPTTKPLQGGYAIFVGNLDQHTHEDKIRDKLEFYGINISSMTAKKPSTKQTSYPMFYLFVNLTSPEDVERAVNILNRKRIGTSIVTVSARDNDKQKIQTGSRIIHIGNMPQEYSGEPLVHMLARLGIHLNENDFKLLRNHAFIRLVNQDSTLDVLSELQLCINRMYRSDRKITVEIARSDPWQKSNRMYLQSSAVPVNKNKNAYEHQISNVINHCSSSNSSGSVLPSDIPIVIKSDSQQHKTSPISNIATSNITFNRNIDRKPIHGNVSGVGSCTSSMVVLQMQPTQVQIQAQIQAQAHAQLQAQVQIQAAHYNLQLQHQKQQYLQQLYGGSTPIIPQLLYYPSSARANAYAYGGPTNIPITGVHGMSHLLSVPYSGLRSVQPLSTANVGSVGHGANGRLFFNPLGGAQSNVNAVSVLTTVPFHAHGISAASRFNPLAGNRIF